MRTRLRSGRWCALVLATACAGAAAPELAGPSPEPAPIDAAVTKLVVHGAADVGGPVSLGTIHGAGTQHPSIAMMRAVAGDDGVLRADCPRDAVCVVMTRGAQVGQHYVLATEPTIEVDVVSGPDALSLLRYHDPGGIPATVAAIEATRADLARACATTPPSDARGAAAEALHAWEDDARAIVRDAAGLAWQAAQCDEAEPVAHARRLLDTLKPTSPAIGLFSEGLFRAAAAFPEGTTRGLEIAKARRDPESASSLLVGLHEVAASRGDDDLLTTIEAELEDPRYAETHHRLALETKRAWERRFLVRAGQPMPSLVGRDLVTRASVDVAALRGRPVLFYMTSLSCGRCKANLPILRKLAAEHPMLQIVIVPLDDEPGAAARLATKYAPTPGVVVDNAPDLVASVRESVMDPFVYPSHVLVDADGTVVATSVDVPSLADLPIEG